MATTSIGTAGVTYPLGTTATMAPSGDGQTWQNLTSSRSLATTYTNSTGRTIMIAVEQNAGTTGGYGGAISINSVVMPQNYSYSNNFGYKTSMVYLVPAGATYSCASSATSLTSWFELR